MITTINTTDGKYGVEFIENDGDINAIAVIHDGMTYGGSSYWFTVGHYKTMKSAIRYSKKALAKLGHELAA